MPNPAAAATGAVPLSLFHSGRAQCPDCGAPLELTGKPRVQCRYCHGTAVVERRLRTLEPVLKEFVTADAPPDAAREVRPSHVIDAVAQDESHCPTCGCELAAPAADDVQAIRRCGHCGTASKVERRLARRPDADAELEALLKREGDFERKRAAEAAALLDRIEKGTDLADRVLAARELGDSWLFVTAHVAALLPRVMELMRTCGDPRIEYPLGEIVGKFLCKDEQPALAHAVLREAEKRVFDVNGSRVLLFQLGLGEGICLKLLLDVADYAASRGATEYACTALWGVATILERHYADRIRLAEIVLYRLLYLRGPVQAWAVQMIQGQGGQGVRFPTPTLLRFMDDCACERPELVPYVHKAFYSGAAQVDEEYLGRLEFLDALLTPEAKSAALDQLMTPGEKVTDDAVGKALERMLALSADPRLAEAAGRAIVLLMGGEYGYDDLRPAAEAFVRKHGDALPEEARRAYFRKDPKCAFLTPLPVKYWQPEREKPKVGFDAQLAEWHRMWDEGIRAAVDGYRERQQAASAFAREAQQAAYAKARQAQQAVASGESTGDKAVGWERPD